MAEVIPVLIYFLALLAFMLVVKYFMRRKWLEEGRRPERSLILVVRNQQEMIEGVLRKIARMQRESHTSIELVVIDNGSRDETPGIITRLARTTGGFSFVIVECCREMSRMVELGIETCRGEKIYYLGIKEKMNFRDIYNGLNEVIVKNPSGYFMPRQYYIELLQQNRTVVPDENKTWGR